MMIVIVIELGSFFACGVDFTLDQSPRTKTSTHIVMVGIQKYEEIHKYKWLRTQIQTYHWDIYNKHVWKSIIGTIHLNLIVVFVKSGKFI